MSTPDLLTVNEAAGVLNVSTRFIRRIVQDGRIEVVHVGKHIRIRRDAIERFIEAGTVPATK